MFKISVVIAPFLSADVSFQKSAAKYFIVWLYTSFQIKAFNTVYKNKLKAKWLLSFISMEII
jgi:hypothetical protein